MRNEVNTVIIRNFLKAPLEKAVIHEGEGLCDHCAVFEAQVFEAPIRFLNYTIIPPSGSFGQHTHGNDNEIYIILDGQGEYTENGCTVKVTDGDILVNAPFASHGIKNTGPVPMRILVLEAYN